MVLLNVNFGALLYTVVVFTALPALLWGWQWLKRNNENAKKWDDIASRAQSVAVGSAHEGLLHLEGRAQQAVELLRSPLHGMPCLAYTLEVLTVTPSEVGPVRSPVFKENRGVPFWLTDQSGAIVVHPTPESKLAFREEPSLIVSGKDQDNMLLWDLRAAGVSMSYSLDYEIIESRLDPGEACGVYGAYSPNEGGQPGIVGSDQGLFITDSYTSTLIAELRTRRRSAINAVVYGAIGLGALFVFFTVQTILDGM